MKTAECQNNLERRLPYYEESLPGSVPAASGSEELSGANFVGSVGRELSHGAYQNTHLRHDRAPRNHGEREFTAPGPRLRHRLPLMAEANRWNAESHNVAADYLRAFGKPAPH